MASITTDNARVRAGRVSADDDPGELVTGEGVTLSLRPTNFVLRAAGCAIDYVVYFVIYFIIMFTIMMTLGPTLDNALFQAFSIALLVLCLVGIPTTVETVTRGKSLGKLAVGARVVRDDGGAIGFRHALIPRHSRDRVNPGRHRRGCRVAQHSHATTWRHGRWHVQPVRAQQGSRIDAAADAT